MAAIFANSILCAMFDYRDRDEKTEYNKTITKGMDFFTWFFAIEAVIKIIAQGLVFAKNSYLRESGNIFDFAIAVSGMVEFFVDSSQITFLKPLRIFRVIRPLKSINALPSMKE